MPHAGDMLAGLLAAAGVTHVFGQPGGQTAAFYDGISREPGLQHILVRDERSGAYAADAFARLTGQPGICDVTVGPGTTKLADGLVESHNASIPIIALVGELPADWAPLRHKGVETPRSYLDELIGLSGVSAQELGFRYRLDFTLTPFTFNPDGYTGTTPGTPTPANGIGAGSGPNGWITRSTIAQRFLGGGLVAISQSSMISPVLLETGLPRFLPRDGARLQFGTPEELVEQAKLN